MWQAERWNTDPTYKPVMIVQPNHIFLRDFVLFKHPIGGCTISQIESLFVDVSYMYICTNMIYECTAHTNYQRDSEMIN